MVKIAVLLSMMFLDTSVWAECLPKVDPGALLSNNWLQVSDSLIERFEYLCTNSDAFECVRKVLFEAPSCPCDPLTKLKLSECVTADQVQQMFCWFPEALPEFNKMFQANLGDQTNSPTLNRNYSIWDVDRFFCTYTSDAAAVQTKMMDVFKLSGPFGEFVSDKKRVQDFFAMMCGIMRARECIEKVSSFRW